jgi:acyl-CoA reductase-like NAD-dependent aldehyde dehydrogenase
MSLTVTYPVTRKELAVVPSIDRNGLNGAVTAAHTALNGWRSTPYRERNAILAALLDRIKDSSLELSALLTAETGRASLWEIQGLVSEFESVVERTKLFGGSDEAAPGITRDFVPLGVIGAISPWNMPVVLSFAKVFPALLAGNTVVLKPSHFAPLTTLRIADYARRILPPGVFNVITGPSDIGPVMTAHPGFNKISFTGAITTAVSLLLGASAKRITVNVGGNDPGIVLPDANPVQIAEPLFWSMFALNGHTPMGIKRLYVPDTLYPELTQALVSVAERVKTGDPFEPDSALGPVQNRPQYDGLMATLQEIRHSNTRILYCGDVPQDSAGFFFPVTIIENPQDDAPFVDKEVFGPIRSILKYRTVEEAVARANRSSYDLGASVWGRDVKQLRAISSQLEAKAIWINQHAFIGNDSDFDGGKGFGLGVTYGREDLLDYCDIHESAGVFVN